ncbi:hypothetical protein SAMN05444166_7329 [Singulisphaera sp. GP187]|uniref:hypothetical protein n=1 Tax=Singulisphaera sp. GP187 TaxID=1882752 RepID=UPI0009285B46|nr:hypothetical protein [Singulisphaera sp. GP187]SIO63379.1 hypothetical protein SAMN05444166_7329 [Singulisphaera sp. GP187]
MTPLRDHLLDIYGGYADQRYKDRNLDLPIKVDEKGPRDVCPSFGSIFVSVPQRTGVSLKLILHHCPTSPEVMDLVETLGGELQPADFRPTIILTLRSSQGPAVKRLARAIRAIIGRGRTYDDPNLRWICPRTATSLEKLAEHLADYYSERDSNDEVKSPDVMLARRRPAFIPTRNPGALRPVPQNGEPGGRTGDRG